MDEVRLASVVIDHVLLLLFYITIVCVSISPTVYLVWIWRRTGSWRRIAIGTLLAVPVGAFTIGGGLCAFLIAFDVFIRGNHIIATNDWAYVDFSFLGCGIYCVGFAAFGLFLTLPLLALWGIVHQSSFERVVKYKGPCNLSEISKE